MNDFLLDNDFDLKFINGDLVLGDAEKQHQQLLLLTTKGEIREFPVRGVGLRNWLLEDNAGSINGAIKREFEADGMTVESIRTIGDKLETKAYYE